MITGTAKFESTNATIMAKLSTGEIAEVCTTLIADGDYRQWTEDVHPDGIGYYETYSEQAVDEDNAEVLYSGEWEFADKKRNRIKDDYEGISIVAIDKIINADWVVDMDTFNDGEDYDREHDR